MYIKKFYDADPQDKGGEVSVEAPKIDLMAAMAKQGKLMDAGSEDDVPEYTPQDAGQTEEVEGENAVTATAAETQPEETQPEQPEAETEQPIAEPETEPVRWQEVIKKEQPETVLKELGFDDKVVGFLNYWKNGGDLKEYFREASTDYQKMPAEDVMRHQLRVEYSKASDAQLEVLYQDRVLERYKLTDDYSEAEQERGRLLLEAEADKYRDTLVERQQKYLLPEAPKSEPKSQEPDPMALEQQKMLEDSKRSVIDSSLYRQIVSTNKITVGEGDEAFSFPVNPKDLADNIYDAERMVSKLFNVSQVNGKVKISADPKKQLLVAAVMEYGDKFLVEMAKHYKAVGGKKAIEPIENPSKNEVVPPNSTQEYQNLSPAALLAKHGVVR